MTTRELPPRDAELIAAFLDKKLPDDERQAFLERLDKDEALYEVFVETVRYRDEQSGRGGELIKPTVWRKKWFLPAAVAAALAVAAVSIVLVRGGAEESYAEMLVADGRLEPYLTEGWYEQGWSNLRGRTQSESESDAAFRVGVLTTDLDIALRSERWGDAAVLSKRIQSQLREIEFAESLRAVFYELTKAIESERGTLVADLRIPSNRTCELYLGVLAGDFRLGRWTETGKLAAQSGNAEVLASRRFRSDLKSLESRVKKAPWGSGLKRIGRLLPRAGVASPDFRQLHAEFAAIIEAS